MRMVGEDREEMEGYVKKNRRVRRIDQCPWDVEILLSILKLLSIFNTSVGRSRASIRKGHDLGYTGV